MRQIYVLLVICCSLTAKGQWLGLTPDQTIPTANPVYQITLANTNPDIWPDLVLLQTNNYQNITILPGDGKAFSQSESSFTKQENYRVTESGDLNADGIDDLAISGYWNNGFQIFWGNANGQYSPGEHYPLTGHGKNLKIVDINKDGANDIIALSGGSGQPITLHLFTGNKSKTLTLKSITRSQLDTDKRIQVVDKNQDGLLDVMVASSFPWFVIFYQQPNGDFIPRYWPNKLEFPFTSEYYLDDFDNDDKQDILAFYFDEGFRFYKGLQDTLFNETYTTLPFTDELSRLAIADINLDGNKDLIVGVSRDFVSTSTLYYFLGNGDFTFEAARPLEFPSGVERFIIGDYNLDSFPDIMAYCTNVGVVIATNLGMVTSVENDEGFLKIYPNPFTDKLSIENTEVSHVQVYDPFGKLITENAIAGNLDLETVQWPNGIYLVKISDRKSVITRKVVKP